MEFKLVEPGFASEDEGWQHARGYVGLLKTTGALDEGWMIAVRQVSEKDSATGSASWGIYAVRQARS